MLALPHLVGTECIAVLEKLGFVPQAMAGELTTLVRRGNQVVVPRTATLSPALVAAILRSAGVDALDFLNAQAPRSLSSHNKPARSAPRRLCAPR